MKISRLLGIGLLLAFCGSGFAITQSDVVGYWTHEFRPGFNLVAFPVLPETPTLQAVIGAQLGAVEITSYDRQLHNYRWACFDPQTNRWSGNLYLLSRSVAFWIYLPGNETKRLVVTGHPELYTKFNWNQLRLGWQFYAPTYGKSESLANLPPIERRDLLLNWDSARERFGLAEATNDLQWHSVDLTQIAPDKAYIALLHHQPPRQVGPPIEIEALYERYAGPVVGDNDGEIGNYHRPPEPLIVGNDGGLAVCNPTGEPCSGELTVIAIRERVRIGQDGALETVNEPISEFRVVPDQTRAGRFNLPLAMGGEPSMLRAGDRLALIVRDGRGGETRSTSFEVPVDERIISDVEFTDPLRTPDAPTTPLEFALGAPFPNPFNDRFALEVRLPEASQVVVTIYDVLGRNTFAINFQLGAGIHRTSIPAGKMAAGIYLVQVTAGEHKGLVKVAHLK